MRISRGMLALVTVPMVMLVAAGCATLVNERQMTLDEIVSMSQAGVGDNVIERQIDATRSEFDLTPDDISRLKQAGVSDDVIETMIESGETPRYFSYEDPYNYWYHYYGYPYYPYTAYRRSGLLGRFYFYGPPYPYGIPNYGEYERWRGYLEEEYDRQRRGITGSPDLDREGREQDSGEQNQ